MEASFLLECLLPASRGQTSQLLSPWGVFFKCWGLICCLCVQSCMWIGYVTIRDLVDTVIFALCNFGSLHEIINVTLMLIITFIIIVSFKSLCSIFLLWIALMWIRPPHPPPPKYCTVQNVCAAAGIDDLFLVLQGVWSSSTMFGKSSSVRCVLRQVHDNYSATSNSYFSLYYLPFCRPAHPADVERLGVLQKQRRWVSPMCSLKLIAQR